ncbi:MAG: peptidoglycan recognition family protein [Kiritimatiellia bacterium]
MTDPALAPLIEANQGLVVEKGHWKYLVAHHSATPTGNAEIFGQYHSNIRHMENGLAYHFVIGNGSKSEDGQLEVGQRWIKQLQGGHVHSDELNKIAIGICLVGNFESQQPTEKQVKTANALIDYLMQTVIPNPCEFTSHKEIQPHSTLCPGRFFPLEQMHERFG